MTAIAIWYNNESGNYPSLWTVADTLVCSHGDTILLEDASKVYGLPVICKTYENNIPIPMVKHHHTYGYCFAGSTLLGQNTYLSLLPLLGNLFIRENDTAPTLEQVSIFIHNYFKSTFNEFKQRVGPSSLFEAAIYGWCHNSNMLQLFRYFPEKIDGTFQVSCEKITFSKLSDFVYLGSEKNKMINRIDQAFKEEPIPGRPTTRVPRYR